MKYLPSLLLTAGALILIGQGCPTPQAQTPPREEAMQQKDMMEKQDVMQKDDVMMEGDVKKDDAMQQDAMMPKGDGAMEKTESMLEQKSASTYEPFTKAKYEAARAANKPVLLFFYANWCPFCKEQDPRFASVIPAHEGGVVALRVNYNDTETDEDEKMLAKEFGVTYQHTMLFIGRDGQTKKKAVGKITDEQTREYLDFISN